MKKRNSQFELLRILSMFFIVLSHYTVHNGVGNYSLPLGFNRYLLELGTLGNLGVIIFVMITGYFCVQKTNPFKLKKLVLLILQVMFYSVCFYVLFSLLGNQAISKKELMHSIFAVTFKKYWFASVYVILYIFTPYINKLIYHMTRKEHKKIILIGIIIFSILAMLSEEDFYANELIQFILFYMIGAYFGRYKNTFFSSKKNCLFVMFSSALLLIISVVAVNILGVNNPNILEYSIYLLKRTSIVCILLAICILNCFKNAKPFTNAFINTISSAIFGVYLISDNKYVRGVLWTNILRVPEYVNSPYLILHMLLSVLVVIIICVIIELIRKNTFERLNSYLYDFIEKKVKKAN